MIASRICTHRHEISLVYFHIPATANVSIHMLCIFGSFFLCHNKLMRMLHGNTTQPDLSFAFANVDGVVGRDRSHAILDLDCDIIALTETHLTQEHQKILQHSFPGYQPFWGAPVSGKKGGVGFLVRTGSTWHAKLISISASSPCYKYFQEGRLVVLSLQIGNGSRQILIYNAYGYSGARWNHGLKSQTHAIVESALQDSISRGLPALFGGDLNLQLDESSVLQRMTQFDWFHLPSLCNSATTSTCFKGKGSAIDHIFCNSLAFHAFTSFSIGSCISDHASLQCTFSLQVISQTVHRNRTMTSLPPKFQFPIPLSSPVLQLGKNFSAFLQKGDIASAYKLWCNYAEAHLKTLWTHVDENAKFTEGRGSVRVDAHAMWPVSHFDSAATLHARRLWKLICRMDEITKRP